MRPILALKSCLYKVRFGNYTNREDAVSVAEILKSMGVIEDFYIINPEEYAVAKSSSRGRPTCGMKLVKAAKTFIGVPISGWYVSGRRVRLQRSDHDRLSVERSEPAPDIGGTVLCG